MGVKLGLILMEGHRLRKRLARNVVKMRRRRHTGYWWESQMERDH
jgi:hypothetical protein